MFALWIWRGGGSGGCYIRKLDRMLLFFLCLKILFLLSFQSTRKNYVHKSLKRFIKFVYLNR